jgi:hypothetical protein
MYGAGMVPLPVSTFGGIAAVGLEVRVWYQRCKQARPVALNSPVLYALIFAGARFPAQAPRKHRRNDDRKSAHPYARHRTAAHWHLVVLHVPTVQRPQSPRSALCSINAPSKVRRIWLGDRCGTLDRSPRARVCW